MRHFEQVKSTDLGRVPGRVPPAMASHARIADSLSILCWSRRIRQWVTPLARRAHPRLSVSEASTGRGAFPLPLSTAMERPAFENENENHW